MSREDWAPGAIITVFINCIVDGSWQRRRLGVMNAYAADVHSIRCGFWRSGERKL